MKKVLQMFSRAVLCFAILFAIFTVPAQAKTGTKPSSGTASLVAGKYGQQKTEFTFSTTTTGSTKLYYNCTKGMLWTTVSAVHNGRDCYGFYEVQVWGKKGSSWVPIYAKSNSTQKNVKDSKSGNLTIKGYTTYKVAIYSWNTKNFGTTTPYGSGCFYVTTEMKPITGKTYSLPKISFSWSNAK